MPIQDPRPAGPVRFVLRHRWSLSLALLSAASFVVLAMRVHGGQLLTFDRGAALWVQGFRGQIDRIMLVLTWVGSGKAMTVLCSLAVVALLLLRRRREMLFMAISGLGALGMSTGLKLAFQRARPTQGAQYLITNPGSFSFPSGHAMGSMCVVASLLVVVHVLRWPLWARIVAFIAAGLFVPGVALSRVYLGVHYTSDVIGGQLAAAAWVSALTGWFYPRLLPGEATEHAAQVGGS